MPYDLDSLHPTPAGWIRRSGIPQRYRGLSLDDTDEVRVLLDGKALRVSASPVAAWLDAQVAEGLSADNARGLLLTGKPGVGKTRLMSILLQEIARRMPAKHLGHNERCLLATPVGFIQFAELMEKRKRMFSVPEESDDWSKLDHTVSIFNATAGPEYDVRVAGIDDVGKEHTTASRFSQDSFDYLLRRRFDLGYPTIVTSNLRREDWGEYGDSMVSFAHEALTEAVIVNRKGDARR